MDKTKVNNLSLIFKKLPAKNCDTNISSIYNINLNY